ncbi:MAG: response regulator [Rhodospirillales bacterium]
MTQSYLAKIKFLIVEDNAFMRTIVRRVLAAFEVGEIMEAAEGKEALKILESFDPDIAIIDWEMEPMDGIEFTKTVRTSDDSSHQFLPIIMLSAHSEINRITEARDAGVNEFVVKPISAKVLFDRIQSVIERPRQFVRLKEYFGPDRRRRTIMFSGPERREMKQDEVNVMFNPEEGNPQDD